MKGPMLMGKKGTPPDYSQFNERAKAELGYIPKKNQKLSSSELYAMGFIEASGIPYDNPIRS